MDKSHQQAQETRKRNQELREERQAQERAEAQEQIAALKLIRDNPDSTIAERMEAIKMISDYTQYGYIR